MPEAESAIKGLIETSTGNLSSSTAIWAVLGPQDAIMPYITFEVITDTPTNVMGAETAPSECRFSLSIFAATFLEIVNITNDMRTVFNRYSGTTNSVVVQDIFFEGRNDSFDETDKHYQRVLDFRMFYNE